MNQYDLLLEQAKALLQQKRWQESEATFKQLLAFKQHVAESYYGIGVIHLNLNDLSTASRFFNVSLQVDPNNANALYQLGFIAEKLQNWAEASAFYTKALMINPQHMGAKAALTRLHIPSPSQVSFPQAASMSQSSVASLFHSNARPQDYGVYEYLLQDKSPLSKMTIEGMDALRREVRPSFTAYLGSYLMTSIFLFIAVAVAVLHSSLQAMNVPVAVLVSLILSLLLVTMYVSSVTYTIDKGRLQIKRGVLRRKLINIELWRVHNIELDKSLLNRITGDGYMRIEIEHGKKRIKVKGFARGNDLEGIYQQLLNLVFLLRSNPFVKGIIY